MYRSSTRLRLCGATLVAVLLMAVGNGISLAGPQLGRTFEPIRMIAGFVERLDLTAEQRAQIRVVLQAHEADLVALVEREAASRLVLFQAIHQAEVNEPAVRLAHRAVAAADADLAVERAEIYTEIEPILTDTQKAELIAFTERVRTVVREDVERSLGPRAGLNKLNLSDEQRAAIRAIVDAHSTAIETLAVQELEARSALVETIRMTEVNESAVREASSVVAAVDVELAVERAEIIAEIEDTLTPEQREKLAKAQDRLRQALADRVSLAFTIGMRVLV